MSLLPREPQLLLLGHGDTLRRIRSVIPEPASQVRIWICEEASLVFFVLERQNHSGFLLNANCMHVK